MYVRRPNPGGPVDNQSTHGIPVNFKRPDTTLLCPIYRDSYFHENRAESPLFGELNPTYILYNSIIITHPGFQ